jgi:predicted metal-dependent peptidase
VEITTEIPTACTDGWNRKYNPDFVATLNAAQLNLLVLHECDHVAYAHLRVWQDLWKENAQLANIAADHFVNLSLMDTDDGEGFLEMPTVGVQPDPQYRGKSVRQIFDMLKKNPPPKPPEGGQPGQGDGLDEHDWEGASEQSAEEAAKRGDEIQRALRQGESVRRKLAGVSKGGADGVFGDLLNPKVDWRKVLRNFITETCAGRDESTWRRPNRRYLAEDIYMPSMLGTTLAELVIGFDTSGSVFGSVEMMQFVAETTSLINELKPSKCHVIYWDTAVAGHQVFEDGQFAVQSLKPKGGGGTDGSVLFNYLREKRIAPQAIVQFTDGYVGSWGRADCPTLWAITTTICAPYGTTIHLGE